MRLPHRMAMAAIAVLALMCNCWSKDPADVATARTDGVHVEVRNGADRAVFCFRADAGYKIAAGYGIELHANARDKNLWSEPTPKLFSDDNLNYFRLPLRVDLSARGDVRGHGVHVKLGACHLEVCKMYDFDLAVPVGTRSAHDLACSK